MRLGLTSALLCASRPVARFALIRSPAVSRQHARALLVCGVDVPNARPSAASRALDDAQWPAQFPYSAADLQPADNSRDELFYLIPRFLHHAAPEARKELATFYAAVLPPAGQGAVLDLCSSWTSHYPEGYRARRCCVLGLNPLELLANPCRTELRVQNLNLDPALPFADDAFDAVTLSLSVDYMTSPLELFGEIHRVLRPGGIASMAFTNRCFQHKVVRRWLRPFSEESHARLVGSYFRYSAEWADIGVADVSPDGWAGQSDPMVVVCARKALPTTSP
jgi:SAM-dependent methyltransferase